MPPAQQYSHYAVLGLARDCTDAELRKQYRLLALKHHPDRNRGLEAAAAEAFKRVQAAYETLSDTEARARYDRELRHQRPQHARRGHRREDTRGAAQAGRAPPSPPARWAHGRTAGAPAEPAEPGGRADTHRRRHSPNRTRPRPSDMSEAFAAAAAVEAGGPSGQASGASAPARPEARNEARPEQAAAAARRAARQAQAAPTAAEQRAAAEAAEWAAAGLHAALSASALEAARAEQDDEERAVQATTPPIPSLSAAELLLCRPRGADRPV